MKITAQTNLFNLNLFLSSKNEQGVTIQPGGRAV
jgi:hypothetical protein